MTIQIPARLRGRLAANDTAHVKVLQLFQTIDPLLQANLDFFPDYTSHGIPHVQKVLELADRLIPDDVLAALRPQDVCFLVCAITIHDLGMYLSIEGVLELLEGSWKNERNDDLDKHTWADAWEHYTAEVRRFSDEKMLQYFGEQIDVSGVRVARTGMTRKDYLIVGEFLRRHHPRLAHEIAVNGFPGSKAIPLLPEHVFDEDDRELIGLLARSHGMALRDTEEYILRLGDERFPCGAPAFYLMAVLRIADLLDAGKHRAPEVRLDRQAIHVPVSNQEWRWNQNVDMDKFAWNQDRDFLSIQAAAQSTTDFILLENWLSWLQQELDMSWSVISEKYGAAFRLSIHRVRSNILDPRSKARLSDRFLTREARLSANPELLKLLISPLYGDDPSYGVRELVQNAVDACIEREHLEHKRGSRAYKGHVTVKLDTQARTFTIEDNGIGMNEDVLLNYYLSAGSSYRFSDGWTRDFAPEQKPEIARTGKFGVGVLATFLLGERISVTTRHMDDKLGYSFEFGLEPRPLDVARIRREPGTTVTVALTDAALQKLENPGDLDWREWYVFDDPAVEYFVDGLSQEWTRLTIPRRPDAGWFALDSALFDRYMWGYDHGGNFYCNGIRITNVPENPFRQYGLDIPSPGISVIDPAARLKVDLARANVLEFPEPEKLARQLYQCVIAQLLLTPWDTSEDLHENLTDNFRFQNHGKLPYLLSPDSFTVIHPAVLSIAKIQRYVALYHHPKRLDRAISDAFQFLSSDVPVAISPSSAYAVYDSVYYRQKKKHNKLFKFVSSFLSRPAHAAAVNVWFQKRFYTDMANDLDMSLPAGTAAEGNNVYKWKRRYAPNLRNLSAQPNARHMMDEESFSTLITQHQHRYDHFTMPINEACFNPDKFPCAVDCVVEEDALSHRSLFADLLMEYLGPDIWIPYDMEERKKKFPKAFKELVHCMDRILGEEY